MKKSAMERHGLSRSPEYRHWDNMIARCERPSNPYYFAYGAMGVKVYPEWRESFQAFYDYVGPRPSDSHSIDRINYSRGYEPGNIRWATKLQQTVNQRMSRLNRTGYKGVAHSQTTGKWRAFIAIDSKQIHIGTYQDLEEAAYMRDQFALALWGDDAYLNVLGSTA